MTQEAQESVLSKENWTCDPDTMDTEKWIQGSLGKSMMQSGIEVWPNKDFNNTGLNPILSLSECECTTHGKHIVFVGAGSYGEKTQQKPRGQQKS